MNRQQKNVRRVQAAMWAAVITVQLCAVTKMKVSATELEMGNAFPEEQVLAGDSSDLAGGMFLQSNGSLVVKSPAVRQKELLNTPETNHEDRNGQSYRLARWEIVPVQFPGHQEELRQTEEYLQVEDISGIPERMEITAEWDGQTMTVDCGKESQRRSGEAWVDGFRLPVTFHGYHADYYELGDLQIPHNEDHPQLEGSEDLLLEMAGLSPSTRRIETIVWDGPAYTAEDGELRRDALAAGQKLVADYQVTYTGTARFPEQPGWQTMAVYEPVEPEITVVETTSAVTETTAPAVTIEAAPVPLWQKITRTFLVTVGLGGILAAVGLAVLAGICLVKKRKV